MSRYGLGRRCDTCALSRKQCRACALDTRRERDARKGESVRAQKREWAQAHPDRIRAATDKWRAANPETFADLNRWNQHSRRGAAGDCPRAPSRPARSSCPCGALAEHIDHIVPVSRGGCNGAHNLRWLCAKCNLRKSASLPEAYDGCPIFWGALGLQ